MKLDSSKRGCCCWNYPRDFYLNGTQGTQDRKGSPSSVLLHIMGLVVPTQPPVSSTSPEGMVKGRAHHVLQRHRGWLWLTKPSYFQLLSCLLE